MPRPRTTKNRNLPPNLYRKPSGHFQYRRPDNGQWHGMGKDRAEAIKAARYLNAQLIQNTSLTDRILKPEAKSTPFRAWMRDYEAAWLEGEPAATTRRQILWQIKTLSDHFGDQPIAEITTAQIADFLDVRPARMSNVFRARLHDVFNAAIAKGKITVNPVTVTKNKRVKVQRQRLTLEQFQAIRKIADPLCQCLMDLALVTLQRREDLSAMRFADIHDGALHVVQHKTGTKIRIALTPPLERVIASCRASMIASPHVLHHRRNTPWFKRGQQNSADQLTRLFAKYRNQSGLFDDIDPKTRPTLHEIRSLGARLYKAAGMDPQALLGHKSAAMTEVYIDARANEWVSASAEIDILTPERQISV